MFPCLLSAHARMIELKTVPGTIDLPVRLLALPLVRKENLNAQVQPQKESRPI
jgi:hypothetical protein